MGPLKMLSLTLCVVALVISANGKPYQKQEEDCDDNQHAAGKEDLIRFTDNEHNALFGGHSQKVREQYEQLKQKADKFVSTSGSNYQDLGVHLHGGSFNKFEAGQSQQSSSSHSSGLNGGIRTPVATNFYNNDGSLLHTVEGLKAHGQGVQYTATAGMLPLKNYQEGQVFTQNNGGFGSSYEKHTSSSSQQASNLNSGLPATIIYTPTGWEKHHQSSSLTVEESTKRRNYTDYSKPELISQQSNTVIHPLNVAYGAQATYNQGSKTHANYDNSNSGSYGVYQVPITVIPQIGSNDANYLSEIKSQSLSKHIVSSHDSTQGAVDVKPIKVQTAPYVRPTPLGVDQMWHTLVNGQTSSQVNYNPSAVIQTSYGTTESEDESSHSNIRPIALTLPQKSQFELKQESQQSSSFQSSQQSSSGSSINGQSSSQIKGSSSGRVPTNTYVGNPSAPQNSGYDITGENKGFYAKSVELASLLSATIAPMEGEQNQKTQQNIQQSSSSQYDVAPSKTVHGGSQNSQQQSGYATTFIQKERNPAIVTGGKGYAGGYQNSYEKHESSSSQYEKTQGSQISGGQGSYSGVPVIDQPYRGTGSYNAGGYNAGYNAGSSYDWSTSGNGYGQYSQQKGQLRPVGWETQAGSGYNNGKSSSSFQSYQSSKGSQSSAGRGVSGVACRECSEGVAQIQQGYRAPVSSSYGLSSQFSSSSSNINGQKSETKEASVTINDNGKVDSYHRHNK